MNPPHPDDGPRMKTEATRFVSHEERQSQCIDFTWHGSDEGDELTSSGHAEIVAGGRLDISRGEAKPLRAQA